MDSSDFMNHTAPELGQSECDITGGVLDRSNGAKRRRKPRRKKKNSFIDQNQTANLLCKHYFYNFITIFYLFFGFSEY